MPVRHSPPGLTVLRRALVAAVLFACAGGAGLALIPAPADLPSWAVPAHPGGDALVTRVAAGAYLTRRSLRDTAAGRLLLSPPAPAPAAPPPLGPPPAPDRPIVPAALRVAPSGWAQELEQGYLDFQRVRGETLLSLDAGPLAAVAAGGALTALRQEVEARRQEHRPARLAITGDRLVLYRGEHYVPTALLSYVDDTADVDPRTGRTLPRPVAPDIVRETLTFERLDGTWKAVTLQRERIGYLVAVPDGALHSRDALPLRERLDAVLDQAWLTNDARRLPEVLAGEALSSQAASLERSRALGVVFRQQHDARIADHMTYRRPAEGAPEGAAEPVVELEVDEVYRESGVFLDARTARPLPRLEPPLYRRRVLRFALVEGEWKCVWWSYWRLGEAIS